MFQKLFFPFIAAAMLFQTALAQDALELNKPLEREISGDAETQSFQISLNENQYAKIAVEQIGVDVAAKIFDANGKLLNAYNNELRLKQNEIIDFVAAQNGTYKIEIKTNSKAFAGNYKIVLTDVREASERDRTVYETLTILWQAKDAEDAEKFDEANTLYKRALEISQKNSEISAALISQILNRLIDVNISKGDHQTALNLLERASDFNSKNLDANHPNAALTTLLRGQYFRRTGDRANADRNFRQALTIYENALGKENPAIFDSLMRLSSLYISLNDYDAATANLQRAEQIVAKNYGADHKMMAGIVNNLGVVFMSKKDYDTAEKYFLRTIAIGEKANESEQYRYTLTMQNLGVIYREKKDFRRSLDYYERTLKIREKILGKEHLQVGWALYGIAGVYYTTGELGKALEILQRVREITEKSVGLYDNLATTAISDSARIYAAQNEIEKAVALQKIHDERYEKWFSSEMTIGSERQKLQSVTRLEKLTSTTVSLHLNAARNNRTALDLAALAVLQRKGRVLDAVADNLSAIRRRANEKDRILLDRLNDANARLAKLTLNKPPKISSAEYEKKLDELQKEKEQIEIEIGDQNAKFAVKTPLVTLDAIKAEIPDDAALVEFAVYLPFDFKNADFNNAYGEPRYVAYVLHKNGDVKFAELGDKKTIDKTIGDFRKALGDPKNKNLKTFSRAADEKIMKPIRAALGDSKQIFVSPDGDLNLIPFESLIDEKGKYLIENFSFNYLTSGRDFLRMKKSDESKGEFLIIANPSFSGENETTTNVKTSAKTATRNMSDTYFAPLAGTLIEARSIQNLFPDAQILSEKQATETALKEIAAPHILHIATHGFFLENASESDASKDLKNRNVNAESETENPLLRSGIALAGANKNKNGDAKEDGILTALEASGLNLWGTKLVVLSACDTGLGEVKNGEGVYGLRRAFTLAGTESLVMSLWSVSDYATRELMTDYYKNLKNGIGRGEALRQVKLAMMKKKGREHPFYWAGFIQSGEWANLEGKR